MSVRELTEAEVEAHVTHTEKRGLRVKVVGNNWKEIYRKYAYFSPDSGSNVFYFYGHIVPLSPEKYGFSSSRKVRVSGKTNKIKFSPEAQHLYDKVFANSEVPLDEAMEAIAKCVNDSMEYDAAAIESENYSQAFKDKIKSSGYAPRGDETLKGICIDAGNFIRQLIETTLDDPTLRYARVGGITKISEHDTTLIFDTKSGEWAAVNSKSPLNRYNLVPKEKLAELGYPYSSVVVS